MNKKKLFSVLQKTQIVTARSTLIRRVQLVIKTQIAAQRSILQQACRRKSNVSLDLPSQIFIVLVI